MVMEAMKCLSVKNPWGYLICAGVKDVENRTWETDYRGRLYIHASGEVMYDAFIPGYEKLLPLHHEYEHMQFEGNGDIVQHEKSTHYIEYSNGEYGLREDAPDDVRREYTFIMKYVSSYSRNVPFFKRQAIIGSVELVDITRNSQSKWAEPGAYHWVMMNQEIFDKPILYVKGALKIFDYMPPSRR